MLGRELFRAPSYLCFHGLAALKAEADPRFGMWHIALAIFRDEGRSGPLCCLNGYTQNLVDVPAEKERTL